jgi:hypothetical protein
MTYATLKSARAQVTLACLLQKPAVTAPIVGAHVFDEKGSPKSATSREMRISDPPVIGKHEINPTFDRVQDADLNRATLAYLFLSPFAVCQ